MITLLTTQQLNKTSTYQLSVTYEHGVEEFDFPHEDVEVMKRYIAGLVVWAQKLNANDFEDLPLDTVFNSSTCENPEAELSEFHLIFYREEWSCNADRLVISSLEDISLTYWDEDGILWAVKISWEA